MTNEQGSRRRALLIFLFISVPSVAGAQAWVNPKGELTLSVHADYQTSDGVWHGPLLVTGLPVEAVNTSFEAEYIPVDKLALGATLYANGVRYSGPDMIPGFPFPLDHGPQDANHKFNWNVTDLELETRYQLYDGAFTFTPLIHVRVPVTDYPNVGYAASGSHLTEGGVGFALGKYGVGLEDLVLQLGYQYTYVAKYTKGGAETEQYRPSRSDADLSLSYVLTEKFIVGAGVVFRYTHDGFDLADYPNLPAGSQLLLFHDPVLQAEYLAPVAVASYQVSEHWTILGRFADVVWGRSVSNPLSFGLTALWATNLAE
jgi:hypothetical protein